MKSTIIYTWKDTNLRPVLKAMVNQDNPEYKYNPELNAINLAKLFTMSLPGNTLDVFYERIANDIREIIKINPSLLLEKYDIENRIRTSIWELATQEKDN
jgi:hypothetical protein